VHGTFPVSWTLCAFAINTETATMKSAKDLMLAYINGGAEQSGALFATTGSLELPYLASIGLPPVLTGPSEITNFLGFLHSTLYPGFKFEQVKIHIDTPTQVFAEYHINNKSGISGKDIRQQFFGHLLAESGKIARLVEAIDVVVAAEAIYKNGLTDVIAKRS
jgi:uncharacterized protein